MADLDRHRGNGMRLGAVRPGSRLGANGGGAVDIARKFGNGAAFARRRGSVCKSSVCPTLVGTMFEMVNRGVGINSVVPLEGACAASWCDRSRAGLVSVSTRGNVWR